MSVIERVFHAVLFEVLLIILTVAITAAVTDHSVSELSSMILLMSATAVVWNFIFNIIFDKIFTGERVERGFGVRLLHTVAFEGGLLFFTVPIVMYMLNIGWWEAIMMDISMTLGIMVYTMLFNWIYDNVRHRLVHSKESS